MSKAQRQAETREAAAAAAAAEVAAAAPAAEDDYGKGEPFDRLQFGYAPSIAIEAVTFHAATSAKKWLKQRRAAYAAACLRREPLAVPHFEPLLSMLKLRQHWKEAAAFQASFAGQAGVDDAASFLERLAGGDALPFGDVDAGEPVVAAEDEQPAEKAAEEAPAAAKEEAKSAPSRKKRRQEVA